MIVTLKNLSAIAQINSKGAELKSFKDVFGTEYIWCSDPKYWSRSSPVLFPTVGMLKNDVATINNINYNMPRHGFARDLEFKLVFQSEEKAIFNLQYNQETLSVYPYKFNLQITYTLIENQLSISYDIFNIDQKEMYYGIGAHPAFNCPLDNTGKFEEYIIEFENFESKGCPIYDTKNSYLDIKNRKQILDKDKKIRLKYDLFKDDALIFDNISCQKVSLYHSLTGRGIDIKFKGFDYLGIWTPSDNKSPFICIEPWASLPHCKDEDGDFTKKRGVKKLEINEKHTYYIDIITI